MGLSTTRCTGAGPRMPAVTLLLDRAQGKARDVLRESSFRAPPPQLTNRTHWPLHPPEGWAGSVTFLSRLRASLQFPAVFTTLGTCQAQDLVRRCRG